MKKQKVEKIVITVKLRRKKNQTLLNGSHASDDKMEGDEKLDDNCERDIIREENMASSSKYTYRYFFFKIQFGIDRWNDKNDENDMKGNKITQKQ